MTKAAIIAMIINYANMLGIDPNVAVAVAKVESGLNPNAVGLLNEQGLFQVRPEYINGFTEQELKDIRTNIFVGLMKLKEARDNCKYNTGITFVVCYNSGMSVHKISPETDKYVIKIKKMMKRKIYDTNSL